MMIDEALINRYIEESSSNKSEKSKREEKVLLLKFFSVRPDIPYNDLTRQDLTEMLSALNSTSIKKTSTANKSRVKKFMVWMVKESHGTDQPLKHLQSITFSDIDRSYLYDRYYFRDYEELHDTIDDVLYNRGSEFDTFKSAAILVWYGIELKYLPDILKSDINEDECSVIHPATQKKIILSRLAMSVLTLYRDSDRYDSSKYGGSIIKYKQSQFLFRTCRNAHLTEVQIRNISGPVNRLADEIGKTFQWNKIYLNGLYNRIFQYEQENGELQRTDFNKLKILFEKPDLKETAQHRMDMARKFDEYQEFKKCMYS